MVKITLHNFGGEIPRRDSNYLPDSNAVEASNVKLTGGTLRPMRDTGSMQEFIEAMWSVYRDSNWFVRLPYIASFAAGAMDAVRLYVTPHTAETPKIYLQGVQFPIEWNFPRQVPAPSVTAAGAVAAGSSSWCQCDGSAADAGTDLCSASCCRSARA